MRTWAKSACVVLAWSILPIALMAVGIKGSVHPAQAYTRTASSTEVSLTTTLSVAAPSVTATSPATRYVVQPGDTLSGIAARFAVRGGWLTIYEANWTLIGPDPNVIHPGTVLVLPGQRAPVRYTVAPGDTLSRIAAALRVHGGWPTLYAANRQAIGSDPNAIRPGTVLRVPRPAVPAPPSPGTGHQRHPASRPKATPHHPRPITRGTAAVAGMPRWLKLVLLAVGLIILAALLAEPVLVARRRRRQASVPALPPAQAGSGPRPQAWSGRTEKACIVLADHDRLVVTRSKCDNTVYVLRPPGEDPRAILQVARLVLPEGPYGELAKQLGMPALGSVD